MHRCFVVEKILRAIIARAGVIENIPSDDIKTVGDVYKTDYKTLLSLALTCKSFKEPALDELWKRQWGLGNLIKLMPSDLWEESDLQGFPTRYIVSLSLTMKRGSRDFDCYLQCFKRAPVVQDWKILEGYAPRIKWLDMAPVEKHDAIVTPFYSIPQTVFAALDDFTGGKAFLPRLETLTWSYTAVPLQCMDYFDLFLASSTVHVTIRTDCDSLDLDDMSISDRVFDDELELEKLSIFCPEVEELVLSFDGGVKLKAGLPGIVRSLGNLRIVDLHSESTPFSHHLIPALASLPGLERLKLTTDGFVADPSYPLMDPFPPNDADRPVELLTLRCIALEGSLASCAMVLKAMKLPALTTLNLRAPAETAQALRMLLEEIKVCCRRRSLKFIDIDATYGGTPSYALQAVTTDIIKPLEKFKYAHKLALKCKFYLDDAEIVHIANSWPHLRELHLGKDGWYASEVTMTGLSALIDRCRELLQLSLAFHASRPADYEANRQKGEYSNPMIERLGVANSPVVNPAQAAKRLDCLFPEVRVIEGTANAERDWARVVQYLCQRDMIGCQQWRFKGQTSQG